MNHFKFETNRISHKTKGTTIFTIFIFNVLIYLIVWLLIGEIDLLNKKWFVTPFQMIDSNGVLHQRVIYFNWDILYILFAILLFSLIVFSILKYLKKANWDLFPFVIMSNIVGILLFFTGFIPYNNQNATWIIIARFVIIIFASLLSFFVINSITTKYLLSSADSALIYEEIKKEYSDLKKMKEEQESFLKPKKREKNYIEIDEE